MTEQEAGQLLESAIAENGLVPLMQGPIVQIKRVIADCLEADIPVISGMPPGSGKG